MQLPFFSQRKYHPLATGESSRITFTVLPSPSRWNLFSFPVFLLRSKSPLHILTALPKCRGIWSPLPSPYGQAVTLRCLFYFFILFIIFNFFCFAYSLVCCSLHLSLHSVTQICNPMLASCYTSDDTWPNLAALPSPHFSVLPSQPSPAITSHGSTPILKASLLRFSFLPLAIHGMTALLLNLLQTSKLFSPSHPSPDRDMHFSCCHCFWRHVFIKMLFLLSHGLPFLFLLFLFSPTLLNNLASKPFLCSHIALSHNSACVSWETVGSFSSSFQPEPALEWMQITESQHGWGWQRPLDPSGPPRAGCPALRPGSFWRPSRRRLHSLWKTCSGAWSSSKHRSTFQCSDMLCLCSTLYPWPLVLVLGITGKRLAPYSLHPPFRYLWTLILMRSP